VDLTRRAHVRRPMTYADIIMAREREKKGAVLTGLGGRQVACDRTCPVAENRLGELTGHDRTLGASASGHASSASSRCLTAALTNS
jgi:hypothetical protein